MEQNQLVVLVVEDDEFLRGAVERMLSRENFRVLVAPDGEAALEVVQANSIDVVVTDVRMPRCGGVDLMKRLRLLNPESPKVIFMTGFAGAQSDELESLEDHSILAKPFSKKALIEAIRNETANGT